jgi:hypothetical protein
MKNGLKNQIEGAHNYLCDYGCKSMAEKYPAVVVEKMLADFSFQQNNLIKNEIERRMSMIQHEPNGIIRETMIANLLIDL